jgi:DNA-binding NarL/FixJ family response regulator
MKVLIVEDDCPMRELMKRVIADLVDRVDECGDGKDAFAAYETSLPDWVLMDIQMKDVDGLTATEQIINAWPAARILIVTSFKDASLREAARRAGARGYVLKENLLEVRSWLIGQNLEERVEP